MYSHKCYSLLIFAGLLISTIPTTNHAQTVQSQLGDQEHTGRFNSLPFGPKSASGKRHSVSKKPTTMLPSATEQLGNRSTQLTSNKNQENDFGGSGVVLNGTTSSTLPPFEDVTDCTVVCIDDIMLPAKEMGVIDSINVQEGDSVPAGKIIGKIDDEIYEQMMEQARLRLEIAAQVAEDGTGIEGATKKFKLARIEALKAARLAEKGSKAESDMMMAQYTESIAKLELDKAYNDMKLAKIELKVAQAEYNQAQSRIDRHILKLDFDGYVIQILKKPQEHVNVGDDVMRIARMDRLWVTGTVDVTKFNAYELMDRPVTVTVELARGETKQFTGKIKTVGFERQTRDFYMVKAEIENQPIGNHWILQPNMSAQMRIHFDDDRSNSASRFQTDNSRQR